MQALALGLLMNCWAKSFSKCDGKISREHVLSRSVLAEDDSSGPITVTRSGGEAFQASIESLTSKILCAHHNSALSNLDEEAGKLSIALRHAMNSPHVPRQVKVDANLFERWLLKTLINSVVSGFSNIAKSSPRNQSPVSKEMIEIAFGSKQFRGCAGAYFVGKNDLGAVYDTEFHFIPLFSAPHRAVVGMLFRFRNMWFLLWLSKGKISRSARELEIIKNSSLTKLNPGTKFYFQGDQSRSITFE